MAQNYCETIVCSVIKSVSALQLLQDIMIHVSLSSCYGCLRKLVEICTYCFPFYSLSFPASPIFSHLSCAFWNIIAKILWKTIIYLHTYKFIHIYTQRHRYVYIYLFKIKQHNKTLHSSGIFFFFCNYRMHKVSFLGWWFLTQEVEVKGGCVTNV